jgi:hypothetical protein
MSSHTAVASLAVLAASLTWSPKVAIAQNPGGNTYSSAQEASQALVDAVQRDDRKALTAMLGGGARLISTDDDSRDKAERQVFVDKYREMHRWMKEPDGSTVLYVGAENWPFPVPLLQKRGRWSFDKAIGEEEVAMRRLGENELKAMEVCQELVAAQKAYVGTAHDGDGNAHFAPMLMSSSGKRDGLYWEGSSNDSPIGPHLAKASTDAVRPTPFHGYFYHVLYSQGAHAPGGAKRYIVNGKLSDGFAFVAYPAEYRSSGVMTFIVSKDGVVHQKDLGPRTATIARAMRTYEPGRGWLKVE